MEGLRTVSAQRNAQSTTARTAAAPQRQRADARRNRERIVATAHLEFIRHGVAVPMEEIARSAGVGVGTLYRHFSDRESLLRAVIASAVDNLTSLSRKESAENPDPWDALCRFVRRCVELRLGAPLSALRPRLKDAIADIPEIAHARQVLVDVLDPLVRAAQARGGMRSDIGSGDVLLLIGMLIQQEAQLPEEMRWTVMRTVELILDGLSAGSSSPLPGRAVWPGDLPIHEE